MVERDSLESLPAGTLGQYRVRARIGSGGMGDVYDAVHVTLDKRVAIKTLRRRFLDDQVVVARFLREGQLASRMRHPNIVDVTDVGVIDGLPCLVMEHLEGETLSQLIRRDGPMELSALVDFLLPILAAIEFAHDHGVLHRDLKPSNIFLTRSWNGEIHPKVLDFGISKLVHESTEAALTTDSAFVGTPHYASPESVRAEKAVDRRSDQYSMGVILYEGATGVRPFAAKSGSFVSMAMAICSGDFQPPRAHCPTLPEGFERVILRAMSLNAEDRFPGMRELGVALLPFASDRARVIWAPSFQAQGSEASGTGQPSPETQLLQGTGGKTALVQSPSSPPGQAPYSATGPAQPQHGWPPSGAHAYPAMQGQAPPSYNGPVTGPQPFTGSSQPPFVMPAGMVHDRTPSFGAGINSSIQAPAPKKSSSLVALLVVALGVVGVVGILLSRSAARRAAVAGEADPVPVGAPPVAPIAAFPVDVQATPDSAVIELDGVSIGSARLTRQFANDGEKHNLRVSAAGYETLLLEFDATRPPPKVISLRAVSTGVASTTLAGKSAPAVKGKPASPAGPSTRSAPPAKGKPDRPRTDNIDPWE